MSPPKHLAIIMDGNGRWAQLRGRSRSIGHVKGVRIAKKIITSCSQRKIANLTLYAFSSENWLRPKTEVHLLMTLLRRYLKRELQNLNQENIRIKVIGDLQKLPTDIFSSVANAIETTANNTGMTLTFAISYGSRNEITSAVKGLCERVKAGMLNPEDINESLIHSALNTSDLPDPDLIIRTSGEKRLSNFLLWQAAYSEFYFCETLWPDFSENDLDLALINYHQRNRRFGGLSNNEISSH